MQENTIVCPICYSKFDQFGNVPRIFPICGHTFCSQCLEQMIFDQNNNVDRFSRLSSLFIVPNYYPEIRGDLEGNLNNNNQYSEENYDEPEDLVASTEYYHPHHLRLSCPLDKKIMVCSSRNIWNFPKNLAILEVISEKSLKQICENHSKKIRFVCMTDGKWICSECLSMENHSGHKLQPLKEVRKKMNDLYNAIIDSEKQNLDLHKLLNALEDTKKFMFDAIKRSLAQYGTVLFIQQQNILFEIECLIDNEKKVFKEKIEEFHIFRKDLKQKIHNQSINKENFFEDAQERLKYFKSKFEEEVLGKFDTMRKWVESFNSDITPLLGFEVISNCLFEDKNNIYTSNVAQIFSLKSFNPHIIDLSHKSFLHITQSKEVLKIKMTYFTREGFLDIGQLRDTKALNLSFDTGELSEADSIIFNYVWTKPKDVSNLELRFFSNVVPEEICDIIKLAPRSFSSITVEIERFQQNRAGNIHLLLENLFTSAKDLKKFKIKLPTNEISNLNEFEFNFEEKGYKVGDQQLLQYTIIDLLSKPSLDANKIIKELKTCLDVVTIMNTSNGSFDLSQQK